MRRLRGVLPQTLAGLDVVSAEDLSGGSAALPPTDGLRYELAGDPAAGVEKARVVVRPSGTEPKLKCYLEVVLPVRDQAALAGVRTRAASQLAALKADLGKAAGV
jgi:phosphomannomutase